MTSRGLKSQFADRGRRASPSREGTRYPFVYFAIAGLVSLAVVAGGGAMASRRVGTEMAINEVRHLGDTLSRSLAQPNIGEPLLEGDGAAIADFDDLVRNRFLSEDLIRVKLWDVDGNIVYSDEPRLIGRTFGLEDSEAAALRSGETLAATTDLDEPSNTYEAGFGHLLEVYSPIQGPNGEPMLFEAYFRYEAVSDHSSQMWKAFLPIILGTVLVLGLIQLPLAWRLTRRLLRNRDEREQLLRHAIEAANLEDRRIACDLHDEVLQNLSSSSFTLIAADLSIEKGDSDRARALVAEAAEHISDTVVALRALVVDLYPPNLREEGLEHAVADLVTASSNDNLTIALEAAPLGNLSLDTELLAYRTVRESLRNVMKHSGAQNVVVTLSEDSDSIVVEIIDDGKGFATNQPAPKGHVGLRLLSDLSAELNAKLEVESAPGNGTKVRLEVAP